MKSFKKKLWFILPAIPLIALLISWKTSSISASPQSAYSAEEIFRGVIFSEGVVAEKIPEFRDLSRVSEKAIDQRQVKAISNYRTQLLGSVNNYFPSFLEEFKNEILSKDPLRVDAAIKDASKIISKTIILNGVTSGLDPASASSIVDMSRSKKESFDDLVNKVEQRSISQSNMIQSCLELFGKNANTAFLGTPFSKHSVSSDECLALNVAFIVNLVIGINIGFTVNLNIQLNINVHTNVQVEVAIIDGQPEANNNRLKREQLVASLISNV